MTEIFKRIIKDKTSQIIAYCIASIFLVWIYFPLFPTMLEQTAQLQSILKSLPEEILKAFGATNMDMGSIESLLAVKHFGFVWPLVAILICVSLAGNLIAGEIESGTIDISLSMPISRAKIFFSKYLAGFANVAVFVFVSIFCVFPMSWAYGYDIYTQNFFEFTLLSFAFSWAIFSLSMMFSAIFSEKGKVFATMGALLIAMYVINVVSELKESLESIKYGSFFYYFNFNDSLTLGDLHALSFYVFITVAIFSTLAGAMIFAKRDINA